MSIANDNMNYTPETDAAWKEGNAIREWTCRKLERERDEARERERVAITSWDEERQRALREGKRVLEERENFKSIVDKVNELIARWDQPSWKDTAPTARYINALRIAVRAYERQKP